jgi:hypothetical protein
MLYYHQLAWHQYKHTRSPHVIFLNHILVAGAVVDEEVVNQILPHGTDAEQDERWRGSLPWSMAKGLDLLAGTRSPGRPDGEEAGM